MVPAAALRLEAPAPGLDRLLQQLVAAPQVWPAQHRLQLGRQRLQLQPRQVVELRLVALHALRQGVVRVRRLLRRAVAGEIVCLALVLNPGLVSNSLIGLCICVACCVGGWIWERVGGGGIVSTMHMWVRHDGESGG